jgi:prepilin-type N-terminal cleavage/methylation domain-containing protein
MSTPRSRHSGFSMIEMMVVLGVVAILAAAATPSFVALRQRQTLDAVGQEVLGVWQAARMEAAKRNQMVKVGVFTGTGVYCIGATTTTSTTDSTPCDCTSAGACNVATFPRDPTSLKEWRGVTIEGTPTLGANTGVAVIEPRRTSLTETGDAGAVSLNGPTGSKSYRLNFRADRMGRALLCESTAATHQMPAYANRRCGP